MKWSANNKLSSCLLQTISTWCSSLWVRKMTCLRQKDRIPSSISSGNHYILPNITNLWNSPILLHLTNSHTRGVNPTMVINPLDGCQLCFLFRWNMPPPFKSITPSSLPAAELLFMNWTWSLGLWQHLTSHPRPSKTTLYAIKLPLSCYYPIWWLT